MNIKITDEQIAEALNLSGGDVTAASESLGCDRRTVYRHIQDNEELKQVLDDEREKALDLAESVLMSLVRQGKFDAVKFLLATKGKKRGYTEKQEIDVESKAVTRIIVGVDENGHLL